METPKFLVSENDLQSVTDRLQRIETAIGILSERLSDNAPKGEFMKKNEVLQYLQISKSKYFALVTQGIIKPKPYGKQTRCLTKEIVELKKNGIQ